MHDDPGFHRPQSVAALPDAGLEVVIEAKPNERKSLAAFWDIDALQRLRARLLIARWRGQGVRVTGDITALVRQTCVVTLEPLDSELRVAVDRKYLPASLLGKEADPHELIIDPEGDDPPEPLPQSLDLGAMAAEEVALCIDPYPRKPGAEAAGPAEAAAEAENPFAVLKNLQGKQR